LDKAKLKNMPSIKLVPLSHIIIKRLFILFAFLIIVITLTTYNYLIKKMETQFHDQLLEYIIQRGKTESELFRLAKDNLIQLKNEFLFLYRTDPKSDFTDWFESHVIKHEDGTMSSPRQYFDGVWTRDGTFEQGIGIVIAPSIEVTKEIKRRLGIAHGLILKYGPAWRSRFVNLWFVSSEKISLTYWPEIQLDSNLSADYNREGEEWFSKTNKKNNPSRGLIWTGLYFDSLAGQWMISTAMPIDVDGKQIGVIGTDLECGDFFNRNLSDNIVSSYSIILGQDGHIIVHPYKIAETISSRNPKFTVDSANDKHLSSIYKKIKSISTLPGIIDNTENDEILAVTKIEGPDWYLISVYYKALFKDQILKIVFFTIALGLGSLFAASFIIYSVVRKNISQPLGLLIETAENFNATTKDKNNLTGSLTHLKSFQFRTDEVGLLVRTFIKVGTRLRKVYQDLENARQNLEIEVVARTRELFGAKKAAEAANQSKSKFLANMSHELRTPLNVILGFSRIMERDTSITPEQRENLAYIHHSGDQLLALINDVLDVAKIESGKISFNSEKFDLFQFLDSIAVMFRQHAAEKKLLFKLEKNINSPRHVKTDIRKLRQVMINLLGNAINYTDEGSVFLRISEVKAPADLFLSGKKQTRVNNPDIWIRFEIRDTGIGIDQEDIDIIFNRFVQAKHRNNKESGTGLGLSISRTLVQMMGSELKVRSEKGTGSTFFFDLPLEIVGHLDIAKTDTPSIPVGLAPDQRQYSILIVEDHEGSRSALAKLLGTIGFKIYLAADGNEGVKNFSRYKPDLILMDIRMLKMDGLSATKKIKATETGANTPVIALTAHAFENERFEILAAGCDDFIRKPLDEVKLFDILIRHMGVAFMYEKNLMIGKPDLVSIDKILTPKILAQLPERLLAELKSASTSLDTNRTIVCIDDIRRINGEIADSLMLLANEFRFEEILSVINQTDIKER